MKFSCSVDIHLTRDIVVDIFNNPENMQYWQDGFISFHHKSGEAGQVGAQSLIQYDIKGRKMELLETVTVSNLPEEFHGTYEGHFGKNTMHNYFEKLPDGHTRWQSEVDYIQIDNFIMKIMSKLMPGMFRKQTQKWMDQFKVFAENKIKDEMSH